MSTKYIDIDSTYRDRSRFPLPAQFTISFGINNKQRISLVANQIQLYPPISPLGESQLQLEPVSFYNDEQTNSTISSIYNGHMYCNNDTCTELLLDPVVLSSVNIDDPSIIQSSNEYPLGYIPLPRNNNFFINKYIENVLTGEQRQIISSKYSVNDLFLQEVVITNITNTQGFSVIHLLNVEIIPSNTNSIYVGKYILYNDEKYLITKYYINNLGISIIETNTPIEISSLPITVSIVAAESWSIEIETPFTNFDTIYPSYQSTIQQFIYNSLFVVNESGIIAFDMVRHTDNTIGIVFNTLNEIYYLSSTDSTGLTWNTPITVLDPYGTGNNPLPGVTKQFGIALEYGIDVEIIGGNPAIAFTYLENTGGINKLAYIRSDSTTGSTWGTSVELVPTRTSGFVNRINTGKIKLIAAPEDGIDGQQANVGNPLLAYRILPPSVPTVGVDDGNYISISRATDFDGTAWVALSTESSFEGIDGEIVDLSWTFQGTTIDGTQGTPSYPDNRTTIVLYKDTATSELRTIVFGTNTHGVSPTTVATSFEQAVFIDTFVTLTSTIYPAANGTANAPQVIYSTGGDLYLYRSELFNSGFPDNSYYFYNLLSETMLSSFSTTSNINGVQSEPSPLNVIEFDELIIESFDINVLSGDELYNLDVTTLSNVIIPKLISTFSNNILLSNILDTTTGKSIISYFNDPELIVQIPIQTDYGITTPYIITNDSKTNFLSSTSDIISYNPFNSQIVLPNLPSLSTINDIYNNSYFHLYTLPTSPTPLPNDFYMYNDYILIKDYEYNPITTEHIITLSTKLSADLNIFGINFWGDNEYKWEILTNVTDYYTPINFIGSSVSTNQPICYNVSLQSLILPNITLSSGVGNRIAFYPYVYVEFRSINNSSLNILYSNNPNSTNILFKVPITNIVSPDRATFVTLSGGGMTHTITYRPQDDFTFAVYLPNGELFQTLEKDTIIPDEPNFDLQVSAVYAYVWME
jgi:hypothetical protein